MNIISAQQLYHTLNNDSNLYLHNGQYINSIEKLPDNNYVVLYANGSQIEIRPDTKIQIQRVKAD